MGGMLSARAQGDGVAEHNVGDTWGAVRSTGKELALTEKDLNLLRQGGDVHIDVGEHAGGRGRIRGQIAACFL